MTRAARPVHRGVTLIELLVVVSIMLLLMVFAVPMMKPALENRQIRETARAVNVYLGSARVRAIESGRPVGVMIRRDPAQPQAGVLLQQMELPPPYGGDVQGATFLVWELRPDQTRPEIRGPVRVRPFNASDIALNPLHVGDLIQFDYQGPWYRIATSNANTNGVISQYPITVESTTLADWPWPFVFTESPSPPVPPNAARVPFTVQGQPYQDVGTTIRQSAVAPLQLNSSVAIDLECSGTVIDPLGARAVDANGDLTDGLQDSTPVILIFSPTGSLDSAWQHGLSAKLIEPVFLLVGKRERVFSYTSLPDYMALTGQITPEDGMTNWQDTNNLWVMITPQTGAIRTAECAYVDPSVLPGASTPAQWKVRIETAVTLTRRISSQGQTMGGR